jgi:hypothetical protein
VSTWSTPSTKSTVSTTSTSAGQARMSRTSSLQIHPLLKRDQGALDLVDALS